MDRYLAKTGYSSQQTGEKVGPDRPNNLWEPVDGADGHDHGAHGEFDDKARARAPQLWFSQHARAVWGALQLVAPGSVADRLGLELDHRARAVARALAVRHLVQAALTSVIPTTDVRRLGVGVDACMRRAWWAWPRSILAVDDWR